MPKGMNAVQRAVRWNDHLAGVAEVIKLQNDGLRYWIFSDEPNKASWHSGSLDYLQKSLARLPLILNFWTLTIGSEVNELQ